MQIDLRALLSPNKFLPFYQTRKGLSNENLSPVAVELHWTSECNYDCIHCSYGSRREAKGRLSSEQIEGLVSDLVDLRTSAAYISGGGEPTVLKGWEKYVDSLIDGGVEVALITNGVALTPRSLSTVGRMNYVAVSVYSTNELEYHNITASKYFDRQWSAPKIIKDFSSDVVVGARCVLNKINFKRIIEIYERAISSGYDYVIFIPAVDYEGRGVNLGPDAIRDAYNLISDNNVVFEEGRTNALELLTKKVSHYNPEGYLGQFSMPPRECSAVEIRANAFVNYCGGVWLCQPHIGNERFSIGNLKNNRFSEIWNSTRHKEVRGDLNKEFCSGKCRNCRSIAFNQAVSGSIPINLETNLSKSDPFI